MVHGAIDVGVFNVQIGVFVGDGALDKWAEERGIEFKSRNSRGFAFWVTDPSGEDWFGIMVQNDAGEPTKVHECVHLADFIMDSAGVPTGVENTEVRAYLTAHIYEGLCDILKGLVE